MILSEHGDWFWFYTTELLPQVFISELHPRVPIWAVSPGIRPPKLSELVHVLKSFRVDPRDPSSSRGRSVTVGLAQKHILNFEKWAGNLRRRAWGHMVTVHISPKLPDLIGEFNVYQIPRIVISKTIKTCWRRQNILYKYSHPFHINSLFCYYSFRAFCNHFPIISLRIYFFINTIKTSHIFSSLSGEYSSDRKQFS